MTALQLRRQRQRVQSHLRRQRDERRGSTLLIVLVLMAMLASLGVIFYVFAAQERASANYYSDAAKVKQFDIDADTLFDFGVRQLIEGPPIGSFRNSALSYRRHALLPNMLGLDASGSKLDFAPFNGRALNATVAADQSLYFGVNDSESANSTLRMQQDLANLDPDYTYPDNNNVFISYQSVDPVNGRMIVIPSFHRPQAPAATHMFRSSPTWYNDVLANQVLRPHAGQNYVGSRGRSSVSRYLNDAAAQALWGSNVVGFPIAPPDSGNGTRGEQGVWSSTFSGSGPLPPYEYDVDNDGDGIWEGVWLDLDFPPLEDATGQLYVPMFSFTVKDADALLNLNVHGNMARLWAGDTSQGDVHLDTVPFRGPASNPFVSQSNQGLFASEVNPLWALNRRPPVSGGSLAANQYDGAYGGDPFFGTTVGAPAPENWVEAANRDWLYLLMGRYSTSPSDLVPGRWGEEHLLYRAITNNSPFDTRGFSLYNDYSGVLPNPWPGPGQTQLDDNNDLPKVTGDWFGSTNQAFGKPLDFTGLGRFWNAGSPKLGIYGTAGGLPAQWPQFNRYSSSPSIPVFWPNTGLSNTLAYGLFNDAGETVIDADAKKDEDGQFGAEEMQALHLIAGDFAFTTGGQSRLTQLAPYNMYATTDLYQSGSGRSGLDVRRKFTTRSWDRKQFSLGYNSNRRWEFAADADGDYLPSRDPLQGREFPPRYGSPAEYSAKSGATQGDLFRPVLRKLIEVELGNFDQPRYQLRLNVNQLLVGPNGNPLPAVPTGQRPPNIQLSYRPLTPHPDQSLLSSTVIGTQARYPTDRFAGVGSFSSAAHQEYWARIDRQLMARDIFTLLYTLTWPEGINPTGRTDFQGTPLGGTAMDPTSAEYQASVRQLAQYAVNMVDSLDRDNIITRFEYDIDPRNGWGLDDDPYGMTSNDTDRGEVYGVELLDLTLSEALVARAEEQASDLPFTQWNETLGDKHFAYVELRNPGPNTVNLSSRAWRIEVGRDYTDGPVNAPAADMRWLQLRADTINPGELYTIGSTDGTTLPATYRSIMKVDVGGSAPADWDTPRTTWIAPNQATLNLDLRDPADATKFSLTDASGMSVTSGSLYDEDVFNRMGGVGTSSPLFVRLYRRVSPQRAIPSSSTEERDNPYVLVDEIALNDIGAPTTSSRGAILQFVTSDPAIATKLSNLRSRQHAEPMSIASSVGYAYTTSSGVYGNTLGNSNGASTFRNWQKVFDRDFASLGELLQLTLGGFSNTQQLRDDGFPTLTTMTAELTPLGRAALPGVATRVYLDSAHPTSPTNSWHLQTQTTSSGMTVDSSAEQLFFPSAHTSSGLAATDQAVPGRWHRFLEMVEVPSRMQASIPGFPNSLDYPRVPGKININMIRHPEVLAALLDEPDIMRLFVDEDANLNGTLDSGEDIDSDMNLDYLTPPLLTRTDQTVPGGLASPYTDRTERTFGGSTIKSWWDGLIAARDGQVSASGTNISPYNGSISNDETGLFLPGLPAEAGAGLTGSRPFRSFAAADQGTSRTFATLQDTLLRAWPGEDANATASGTANPRQLFELGTLDEHRGQDAAMNTVTVLDPYVRSRLLNKLMNNVTTRSNVFVVFASVKFFRANRTATGEVQIGGPLKPFGNATGLPSTPPDRTDAGWQPEYRRFYVIDRSQIEKAYDPQSKSFNFRALIEFQQNLIGNP